MQGTMPTMLHAEVSLDFSRRLSHYIVRRQRRNFLALEMSAASVLKSQHLVQFCTGMATADQHLRSIVDSEQAREASAYDGRSVGETIKPLVAAYSALDEWLIVLARLARDQDHQEPKARSRSDALQAVIKALMRIDRALESKGQRGMGILREAHGPNDLRLDEARSRSHEARQSMLGTCLTLWINETFPAFHGLRDFDAHHKAREFANAALETVDAGRSRSAVRDLLEEAEADFAATFSEEVHRGAGRGAQRPYFAQPAWQPSRIVRGRAAQHGDGPIGHVVAQHVKRFEGLVNGVLDGAHGLGGVVADIFGSFGHRW